MKLGNFVGNSAKIQEIFRLNRANFGYFAVCHDRWDDIVRNQTDPKFSSIEVSTLSVHYFWKAASQTWCERYNDAVRTHRGYRGDPLYTSERYQQILQMVVDSGIIG